MQDHKKGDSGSSGKTTLEPFVERRTGTRMRQRPTPDGNGPTTIPELPTLEPGITRLEADTRGPLQALVVDHLCRGGPAPDGHERRPRTRWVDSHGHARTDALTRLAPSDRVLERIDVARAFTAYQHYRLLERLEELVADGTGPRETAHAATDTALVVVPELDWFYADDDLGTADATNLLTAGLERLERLATDHDLPVLVTTTGHPAFADRIEDHVDTTLTCRSTRFGPRFTGEAFDTLVYPARGGVQTTLAFWREVLRARVGDRAQPMLAETPTPPEPEVATHGTN